MRPTCRASRPFYLVSTSSDQGGYSRTEPRPRAARGVALVRAGSEGARRGLHDADASVYIVPQAREFNAKFKSGLLPKFHDVGICLCRVCIAKHARAPPALSLPKNVFLSVPACCICQLYFCV